MKFRVEYEVPPLRAIYRMVVEADTPTDAEEKIRTDKEMKHYRIRSIEKTK